MDHRADRGCDPTAGVGRRRSTRTSHRRVGRRRRRRLGTQLLSRRPHSREACGCLARPPPHRRRVAASVVVVRPHEEVEAVEPRLGVRRVRPRLAGDRLRRAERDRVDGETDDHRSSCATSSRGARSTACARRCQRRLVDRHGRGIRPTARGTGRSPTTMTPRPNVDERVGGHVEHSTQPLSQAQSRRVPCPPVVDRVLLIRHGETDWTADAPPHRTHRSSRSTPKGSAARGSWRRSSPGSPTRRRRRCSRARCNGLARPANWPGFGDRATVDDDLAEWDYGEFEGTRTADLRDVRARLVDLDSHDRAGESLDDVARRADRVLRAARLRSTARRCCSPTPTCCASWALGGADSRRSPAVG